MRLKRAFTLIELLMVIAIIGVLSTMALVTLRSVRDDAEAARTRSVISKVRDILQDKLESFESRQIPFGFQKDFGTPPPPPLMNDLPPDWGQQRFIYKRVLCEWIRTEMPTCQEFIRGYPTFPFPPMFPFYPSIESRQPIIPVPRPGLALPEQETSYWPDGATSSNNRQWIEIFTRHMATRPNPLYQQFQSQLNPYPIVLPPNDNNLEDSTPFDQVFPIKENNSGWDGASVPGVIPLTGDELANSITESAELLYGILYTTYDRDGNRGTHFLRPDDLGDIDNDGRPEILDNRGLPLIFSITVHGIGGLPMDRYPPPPGVLDGVIDFRDTMVDPRYPGEPQDYVVHLGSIGLEEYPFHLQHLRHADFRDVVSFPNL